MHSPLCPGVALYLQQTEFVPRRDERRVQVGRGQSLRRGQSAGTRMRAACQCAHTHNHARDDALVSNATASRAARPDSAHMAERCCCCWSIVPGSSALRFCVKTCTSGTAGGAATVTPEAAAAAAAEATPAAPVEGADMADSGGRQSQSQLRRAASERKKWEIPREPNFKGIPWHQDGLVCGYFLKANSTQQRKCAEVTDIHQTNFILKINGFEVSRVFCCFRMELSS